jgi:hypothetical protein
MADSRPAHEGHAGHGNHLTHPRISKAIGCFDDYASSGDQSALMNSRTGHVCSDRYSDSIIVPVSGSLRRTSARVVHALTCPCRVRSAGAVPGASHRRAAALSASVSMADINE